MGKDPKVLEWLDAEDGYPEEADAVKSEVAGAITGSSDSYQIARYLEERCYWSGIDTNLISILDRVPLLYITKYEEMVSRWVAENAVTAVFANGDRVGFENERDGHYYVGEVREVDTRLGRYLVHCPELNHGESILGIFVPFEAARRA